DTAGQADRGRSIADQLRSRTPDRGDVQRSTESRTQAAREAVERSRDRTPSGSDRSDIFRNLRERDSNFQAPRGIQDSVNRQRETIEARREAIERAGERGSRGSADRGGSDR